jgi:hypothetical protein
MDMGSVKGGRLTDPTKRISPPHCPDRLHPSPSACPPGFFCTLEFRVDGASFGRQCRRVSQCTGRSSKRRPYAKEAMSPEGVTFPAADGLSVNADLYSVPKARAFLVLCHRSHFHRGEYAEIAPRLAQLGYDCMAIDQRSGMNVFGGVNETYARAIVLEAACITSDSAYEKVNPRCAACFQSLTRWAEC